MGTLNVQHCPETGICSIIKENGTKVDLMPDEISSLRDVASNPEKIKEVLSDIDASFELEADEMDQLSKQVSP